MTPSRSRGRKPASLKLLDDRVFEPLASEAGSSERRRSHYNLHPSLDDPVQRFCIAAGPESYFRPHRHRAPEKWELFLALGGAAALLLFDNEGTVLERAVLSAAGPVRAVEVPPGAWHGLAVLERGTVLFEVKPGPYESLSDKDFAPWSPAEGSPESLSLTTWLRAALTGDRPPRG